MKKINTNILIAVLGLVAILTLSSGAFRHDKSIEKHLELANNEDFNCVGELFTLKADGWKQGGSFILIDSLHILTAAHCVVGERTKDTVVYYQGHTIKTYIVTGRYAMKPKQFSFFIMNQMVKASKITAHPNFIRNTSCDIAIIRLERPITGLAKMFLNSVPDELHDTATIVGFGVSGRANEPLDMKSYQIKLAGENIIDSIGGEMLNGISTKLHADFDYPGEREGCNKMGGKGALELEYGVMGGDSGGPLFRRKNKRLELIGITSGGGSSIADLFGQGYYCQINTWTRIAAFNEWINNNK